MMHKTSSVESPMAKLNAILQYDLYAKNETGFMSLCKYLTLAMQVIALAHEALCVFFSSVNSTKVSVSFANYLAAWRNTISPVL